MLGTCQSPIDYMRSNLGTGGSSKLPSDGHHGQSSSLPASPRYKPYPKPSDSPAPATGSFRPVPDSSLPCICCGNKGHHAFDCSVNHANRPEHPIIVAWNRNRLESLDSEQICLIFNAQSVCSSEPSDFHGLHSCSLCGNSGHGAKDCTRN